jgi:precorrin-6A synthase
MATHARQDARKLTIVGIGAGDPAYVTIQAVGAMNAADVFFIVTKAAEQDDLVGLRREILSRYVTGSYRVVEVRDPERRRGATPAEQRAAVAAWRAARTQQYAQLLRDHLAEGERGAFLAWGDPTLYESTLTIIASLADSGDPVFEWDVVPGISAVSALAARHRIALNHVGGAVQVTTGRRLADGLPDGAGDVVVLLDPECSFTRLDEDGLEIYWGAYLGTDDELLISGPVTDVADEIVRVRAEARQRKGWVFDTYLLRRAAA